MAVAILKRKTVENAIDNAKELGKKAIDSVKLACVAAGFAVVVAIVALIVAVIK